MPGADLRDLELYCDTDRQRTCVAACNKFDNIELAAKHLGTSNRNLRNMLRRLRIIRDATEAGAQVPGAEFILPGQKIRGVSALSDRQ